MRCLNILFVFASLFVFSEFASAEYGAKYSPESTGLSEKSAIYSEPLPLAVPTGLTISQIREGIVNGLAMRNWIGKNLDANVIEATFTKPRGDNPHKLVLLIHYNASKVEITYASSENLNYVDLGEGKFGLHRNALRWVANLRLDIESQLNRMSLLSPNN